MNFFHAITFRFSFCSVVILHKHRQIFKSNHKTVKNSFSFYNFLQFSKQFVYFLKKYFGQNALFNCNNFTRKITSTRLSSLLHYLQAFFFIFCFLHFFVSSWLQMHVCSSRKSNKDKSCIRFWFIGKSHNFCVMCCGLWHASAAFMLLFLIDSNRKEFSFSFSWIHFSPGCDIIHDRRPKKFLFHCRMGK